MRWLAVLDMDGTLLEKRTIDVLCQELGFTEKVKEIDRRSKNLDVYEVTKEIAQVFAGIKAGVMEKIFDKIKLVNGVEEFANLLRSSNFVSFIVTDSYSFLATRLAGRLGLDGVRANILELKNGIITGRISTPLGQEEGPIKPSVEWIDCKSKVMEELMRQYSIPSSRTLAVGDTINDLGMIQKASIGVAFRPRNQILVKCAEIVIKKDFYELIDKLKPFLDGHDISS